MSIEAAMQGDTEFREASRRDGIEREIAATAASIVDLVRDNPDIPRDELDAQIRGILRDMMSPEENNG